MAAIDAVPNEVLLHEIVARLNVYEEDWVTLMRLRLTCQRFTHLLAPGPCLGDVGALWEREARASRHADKLPKKSPLAQERLAWHRVPEGLMRVARHGHWEPRWLQTRFMGQRTWFSSLAFYEDKNGGAPRYHWIVLGLIQGNHHEAYLRFRASDSFERVRTSYKFADYQRSWQDQGVMSDTPWVLEPCVSDVMFRVVYPGASMTQPPRRCLELVMTKLLESYRPMLLAQDAADDEEVILARRQWLVECRRGSLHPHMKQVTSPAICAWLDAKREEATADLEKLRRRKRALKRKLPDADEPVSAKKPRLEEAEESYSF